MTQRKLNEKGKRYNLHQKKRNGKATHEVATVFINTDVFIRINQFCKIGETILKNRFC